MSFGEVGDKKSFVDLHFDSRSDAVPFITHHENAVRRQFLPIQVLTVEERAVTRCPVLFKVFDEIGIVDLHMSQCSHRSLYGLRAESVGRIRTANDVCDTEPVGQPDNRAQIAGVLNTVEGKDEL